MLKNPTSRLVRAIIPATKISCRNHGVPSPRMAVEQPQLSTSRETLLLGRTALVTNCEEYDHDMASNVALNLAAHGANVLVHGKQENYLSSLLSQFPTQAGQYHALVVSENVGDINAELVQGYTDHLDIFVHNSGHVAVPEAADPSACDVNAFDDIVRQSLTTPYTVFQNVLPLILRGNNPSIIFSSSTPEAENESEEGAYYISKFGFNSSRMLTKMLSKGLGKKNIRINSVDSGRFLQKEFSPEDEMAKTSAFVWLARNDTKMSGEQVNATEWINRDPMMFKSFY